MYVVLAMECLTAAVSLSTMSDKLSVALPVRSTSMFLCLCTTTTERRGMLNVTKLYNLNTSPNLLDRSCACKEALINEDWLSGAIC